MTNGETLLDDRYQLDHEIGRGGMGSVWLGRDTVLGRVVAIKQIGMGLGGGAPDIDRAEREARLAARVDHHNIVAIYDLVDHGGHQWLVMEHIEGPTLAGMISEHGALAPDDVAPLVQQVAGALAAAHENGIVHRDVKPSNILLTHDGVPKLSDFGVARAQADASLTQTGIVTGSPAYLAPEIATGHTANEASDVWSLGATVYHALAGRPPYEVGDNLLGAMYRIVNEEPPRLPSDGQLARLVTLMMQHDPEVRPTMAEIERTVATFVPSGEAAHAAEAAVAADPDSTQGFAAFADEPYGGPDPSATTSFQPLGDPVTLLADATPAASGPAGAPPPPPGGHRDGHGSRPRGLYLGGAAAALVAAVVAVVVIVGGGDDPSDPPAPNVVAEESSAPAEEEAPPADDPADGGTTAEQLEGFAADYLVAASNDPENGFSLLTPAYQDESGGLDGYEGFWGDVDDLNIESVSGDPDTLQVSYRYSYVYDGDPRTEDVTLQLEQAGDSYLIAGTA